MTLFERVREANKAGPPEDSLAVRVTVFVPVMIATLGALNLGLGGPLLRLACLSGLPAGYVLSHLLRNRSRGWLKLLLGIAAILAFVQFLGLFAPALAGQVLGLQAGLVELLLWVQLLHSIDLPTRRDLLFSLGTSGALLIVTAALATDDAFGVTLALWLATAMVALAVANLNDLGLVANRLRRLRGVPVRVVVVGAVGVSLLGVLPPARVFSFGLPSQAAVGGQSTGGRLVNPASLPSAAGRGSGAVGSFGYFGYTEQLDLGFRGRPNDTLVMRVRAPGPDFWRAQSFDTYDGQTWSNSDTKTHRVFGRGGGLIPQTPNEDRAMLAGDEFIQTFYIEKFAPNIVFAAASPWRIYWPFDEAYQLSDGTLRGGDTLAPGTVYSVVSKRLPVTPEWLRARDPRFGFVDPAVRRRYTTLPEIPSRVRDLAENLAASTNNAYDAIQAMTDWIGTHTKYSLNPPRLHKGEDAVEQFLFDDQRGFCEQIAASLVVMLRAVGIPARLTVGYASGHRNPFSGMYEVRASDAHAYTEVLFPGVGWQAFDPTAAVPLAGDASAFPRFAGAGLAAFLAERVPSAQAMGAVVAVVVAFLGAGYAFVMLRRRGRRSWLEIQLARLERSAGVPIDDSVTLPAWLDQLPEPTRAHYAPIVAALEHQAWSEGELDAADRRQVERRLAGSRT